MSSAWSSESVQNSTWSLFNDIKLFPVPTPFDFPIIENICFAVLCVYFGDSLSTEYTQGTEDQI